ncbi:MAG: SGNH/GDSL hydrolase family protein [Chloroflexota bacterium]
MKTLRNFLGRVLLIVVGLVAPLLALEIGVRLANLAPPPEPNPAIWTPHPLLGWWHIPYSGGVFHSDYNEFETEVRINARGLRDREIGYDNPEAALRILSLADSFGEALQVELADTYPKQLEQLLSDSLDRPVEVLNAGVGGWGTDQQAIFYVAEGFRYEPDLVLLAFFIRNDAINNYDPLEIERNGGRQQKQFFTLSPAGELMPPPVQATASTQMPVKTTPGESGPELNQRPPLLPLADALWRGSALYRFLMPYLRDIPPLVQRLGPSGILGGEAVIRATNPTTPIPFYVYQSPPDERFEAAWLLTEAILTRLRAEVESRGARLLVVLIAAPEQVYPEQWQRTLAANPALQALDLDLDAPNRRLDAFLAAENIPHLDLLPVFRRAAAQPGAPPLHFRHDQHWTEAGHRLAAEAIAGFLQQEFGQEGSK